MGMNTLLRIATLACLVVGVVGIATFAPVGCENMVIKDPVTGETRPATPEEAAALVDKAVQDTGNVARVITVVTGQPEALPFVDLGVRVAALIAAFFMNRRVEKTATAPPG